MLWLWYRPAVTAIISPQARKLQNKKGQAKKKKKKKKKKKDLKKNYSKNFLKYNSLKKTHSCI